MDDRVMTYTELHEREEAHRAEWADATRSLFEASEQARARAEAQRLLDIALDGALALQRRLTRLQNLAARLLDTAIASDGGDFTVGRAELEALAAGLED